MHSEGESSPEKETPSGQCPAPQETGPEKKRTIFIAASGSSMFCPDSSERKRSLFLPFELLCVCQQEVSLELKILFSRQK